MLPPKAKSGTPYQKGTGMNFKFFSVTLVLLVLITAAIVIYHDDEPKQKTITTVIHQTDLGKVISATTHDGFFQTTRTEIVTEKAGFIVNALIMPARSHMIYQQSKVSDGKITQAHEEVCQGEHCYAVKNVLWGNQG